MDTRAELKKATGVYPQRRWHPPRYERYIQSVAWHLRRKRFFASHSHECSACRFFSRRNHLHHKSYARLGREPDGDLVPLCVVCHDLVHAYHASHTDLTLAAATDLMVAEIKKLGRPEMVVAMRWQRKGASPWAKKGSAPVGLFAKQARRRDAEKLLGKPAPLRGAHVVIAGTARAKLPDKKEHPA